MLEIYNKDKKTLEEIDEQYQKETKKLDACLEVVSSIGIAIATSSLLTMSMDSNNLLAMTGATILLSPPIYFG